MAFTVTTRYSQIPVSALRVRALAQLGMGVFVGRARISYSNDIAFFWSAYLKDALPGMYHCDKAVAYYDFGKPRLETQRSATWSLYVVALRMLALNAVFDNRAGVTPIAVGLRACCALGESVHLDVSEPSDFRLASGPWTYVDPDYHIPITYAHVLKFLSNSISGTLNCLQRWPWHNDRLLQYAS